MFEKEKEKEPGQQIIDVMQWLADCKTGRHAEFCKTALVTFSGDLISSSVGLAPQSCCGSAWIGSPHASVAATRGIAREGEYGNTGSVWFMRIVVTGATGLLGNNVVRSALSKGIDVIALSRTAGTSRSLAGLPIEVAVADIANWESVRDGVKGPIDAVIHCAAHIHIGWTESEKSQRINELGTQNALQLAADHGCRCIHVSTVNTLAIGTADHIAEEDSPGDGQIPCTYVLSKRAAERKARDAIEQGADVVIVYPGFMLGPWDWKPSSGRMICDLATGAPPAAPSGGCSVCDPRDVANAILSAIDRAPRGGRYILGGENWTYLQLWREISRRLGVRQPWIIMGSAVGFVVGRAGDIWGNLLGSEPVVNSAAIAMSAQFHWYSSERAVAQLGYSIRPASESLETAIAWLREYGYLPSEGAEARKSGG